MHKILKEEDASAIEDSYWPEMKSLKGTGDTKLGCAPPVSSHAPRVWRITYL